MGYTKNKKAGLNMEIIRVKDAQAGGEKAFELIKAGMDKGIQTLGLATGSTPIPLYRQMTGSDLDFSNMTSINLDEYVGLGVEDEQSYRHFMNDNLFDQKPFKETFVPNGKAENLEAECQRYDAIIDAHPVDIQILGIGRNGHIGFNEPGADLNGTTAVVNLTESTIEANKRFFDKVEDVPTKAISMGIASIMKGKQIILMAFGEDKAEAIYGMVKGPVTNHVPASALQNHDDVIVIVDDAAAAKL
ncbi:glucosamine-6-phosphate deaminase [Enterococcus asini]|nr:glucosamine-6-phosphate deaminase [Enterococcus asini]